MLPNQKSTKYLMMKLKKKSKKKINKDPIVKDQIGEKNNITRKKKKSYALRPSWPNKLGLPNKSSGITGLE